jgi:hypothetical protein
MTLDNRAIPPSRQAMGEALALSTELLRNIELSEIPLTNAALKAARLARLLNDFDYQKIMEYEAGGYPSGVENVNHDVWLLGGMAGRWFELSDSKTKQPDKKMYVEGISQLEEFLKTAEASLTAAKDPDVSLSSANPSQYLGLGRGNAVERGAIREAMTRSSQRLASRRTFIYRYVLEKHYELKFSGIADDIFIRARQRVDSRISQIVPDAVQKLTATYENLESENPEDWSNAVHSCRRLLQSLADAVYPASDDKNIERNGKIKTIKLGQENYINRIIAFVQDNNISDKFEAIVGSQLDYLGERLDSIYKATNKGSHEIIINREEAERYVIYTYLLAGDILSLK